MLEALKLAAAIFAMTFMVLSWLAGRRPDVRWLQPFRMPEVHPAIREQRRRRAERVAGVEMILVGICLPIGYLILTVMTFSSLDPWWTAGVAIASIACIAGGITVLVKNWR